MQAAPEPQNMNDRTESCRPNFVVSQTAEDPTLWHHVDDAPGVTPQLRFPSGHLGASCCWGANLWTFRLFSMENPVENPWTQQMTLQIGNTVLLCITCTLWLINSDVFLGSRKRTKQRERDWRMWQVSDDKADINEKLDGGKPIPAHVRPVSAAPVGSTPTYPARTIGLPNLAIPCPLLHLEDPTAVSSCYKVGITGCY